MNMAEKIRNCRRKMDLTQPELADLVGVSPMTVRRWEWNERTPNASIIPKLAEVLNTSIEYLIKDTSEPEPESPRENQNQNEIKNPSYVNMKEAENKIGYTFWGKVLDEAQQVAARGDAKEITLITPLLKTAYEMLSGVNVPEEKPGQKMQFNNVDKGTLNATLK